MYTNAQLHHTNAQLHHTSPPTPQCIQHIVWHTTQGADSQFDKGRQWVILTGGWAKEDEVHGSELQLLPVCAAGDLQPALEEGTSVHGHPETGRGEEGGGEGKEDE